MKKGEKIVGGVENVDFPNKGKVITEEGEQLSVKNVLPGQKVCLRRYLPHGNIPICRKWI
mgnify:CR=1 FL=1